ncbi:uncharacterized protein [Dysidea avara]|uniref:uncharacterized protein n=1 Tax=Dysidea avara TaxID=196820 RepID=UPI00332FD870
MALARELISKERSWMMDYTGELQLIFGEQHRVKSQLLSVIKKRAALQRRRMAIFKRNTSQRRNLLLMSVAVGLLAATEPRPKVQWTYERSSYWWDYIVLRTFTPVDWMDNFRISWETFYYLCQKLGPVIQRENTQLRNAIPVNKRLAMTLWCLATCSEYRTIAHLFGVARCTVCVILHDTCKAIISVLQKQFIKFPCGEVLKTAAEEFKSKTGMIQCVGSIDGCHIPITPPALNRTDYYNRKGWYSVVLQAIVDSNYLFRDVCVGWPGSVHDARVFANSGIFSKLTTCCILHNICEIFGDEIPDGWMDDSTVDLLEQPSTTSPVERPESDAKAVRETLVTYYNN